MVHIDRTALGAVPAAVRRWHQHGGVGAAAWLRVRTARPRTFNQKVRYKMARDHRPLLVRLTDKAAFRGYVAEVVGEHHLPVAYAVLDDPSHLRRLDLPARYVVKPTHGSGAVVAISDAAPCDGRLPDPGSRWAYVHVRPEAVDLDRLVALAEEWLSRRYGGGPNREWAYSHVVPRILVEEYVAGPDSLIPDDYKLFVFHQQCRYVQVDTGRFGVHTQDFFTPEWVHLPMRGALPSSPSPPRRPERLTEMIAMAQRLARDTDFVRVDLYDHPDRIVVGELTSYPAGGHSPFRPVSFDREFGRHWTVPRRYR